MADITAAGTTITMDTDTDPVTTITMATVITMAVVTELNQDVTGIIETEMSTAGTEARDILATIIKISDTVSMINDINTDTITTDRTIIVDRSDDIKLVDFSFMGRSQLAIISKIFPTISPPNVPTIYPIIAMSTPMGISALE